jgi:ribosomal protein S18 acetylase RimI-like enzyme
MARLSNAQSDEREEPGEGSEGGGIVCRRATAADMPWAVSMYLGAEGRRASATQTNEFLRHSGQRQLNLGETWIAEENGVPAWAVLPMLSPGRTALFFTAAEWSCESPAARALVERVCQDLVQRDVQLAQVLIDPGQLPARRFFAEVGFFEVAELIYLHGHAPRGALQTNIPPEMSWETYSPERHELFAKTIQASYVDSLDCPALTGVRGIEDVVAGHKSTGEFDPGLWHVLVENGRGVGVLLLCRIFGSDALELVYLGLAPEGRGRGLGDLLMRQAMRQVLEQKRRRLSLAVDRKNEPALKLYYRFGLARLTSKLAMIRILM